MAGLRVVASDTGRRARRWDAVVLGSGVASLVASVRLGMAGHSVLVLEEDHAAAAFPGLREPFTLTGAHEGGVLDACLKALTVPLVDQRRIVREPLAFQLVGPDLRMNVGEPEVTSEEMVAWNLAPADTARSLVRALREAGEAELQVMLDSALVRLGRRPQAGRSALAGSHVRGLPAEAANPPDALVPLLAAQVRALSNLAVAVPPPEARARLLGAALQAGAAFDGGPPWLAGILRQRIEAVYGEFRTLSGDFELVSVDHQAGVIALGSGEIFVGRTLLVTPPPAALTAVLGEDRAPDFLAVDRPRRQRLAFHFRVRRSVLPEGMSHRVVLLADREETESQLVTLALYARADDPEHTDLVARQVVAVGTDRETIAAAIEQRLRALMPFAGEELALRTATAPRWDDDDWLEDPPPGTGWPGELDLRVSTRPAVYRLDRAWVGGLGFEGDLLLGWRAGDAIARELG